MKKTATNSYSIRQSFYGYGCESYIAIFAWGRSLEITLRVSLLCIFTKDDAEGREQSLDSEEQAPLQPINALRALQPPLNPLQQPQQPLQLLPQQFNPQGQVQKL